MALIQVLEKTLTLRFFSPPPPSNEAMRGVTGGRVGGGGGRAVGRGRRAAAGHGGGCGATRLLPPRTLRSSGFGLHRGKRRYTRKFLWRKKIFNVDETVYRYK